MSLKITSKKEFNNEYHELPAFVKETEKAVAVEVQFQACSTDHTGTRTAWIPKSQIKDNKVKGWLLRAKARDVRKTLPKSEFFYAIQINGLNFQI